MQSYHKKLKKLGYAVEQYECLVPVVDRVKLVGVDAHCQFEHYETQRQMIIEKGLS